MLDAGMTGEEVVAAATVHAAEWIGLPHAGVIEAGMAADLVAFDGDPTRDPKALTRVARVWRRGRAV